MRLIARLRKENHQVFVVTGVEDKSIKTSSGVFQAYHFEYKSKSIPYILDAVKPDVVMYKGIFEMKNQIDSNPSVATEAIAGLTNTLIACKSASVKHFIYLSTMNVFDYVIESNIYEETEPYALMDSNKAILSGEKICQSYYNDDEFRLSIIRLCQIYGVHNKDYMDDDVILPLFRNAIWKGEIDVDINRYHHLLYVDDAVDFIYRLSHEEIPNKVIYHAVPLARKGYSEAFIGEKILEILKADEIQSTIVLNESDCTKHNRVYASQDDRNINTYEKYNLDQGIEKVYKVAKKSLKKSRLELKKKSILSGFINLDLKKRNNVTHLMENILFFILVQLFIVFTRQIAFHDIIDVYLIYVLIIAVIYGYLQAAFAVAFSAIGKIYIDIALLSPYIGFSGYDIYLWIIQIFIVGVLIGYLRDKYQRQYNDYLDERDYLSNELSIIKEINDSNSNIKSIYENRLLNYKDSFARIYDLVSRFDVIEPERVVFKAIHVISDIMKTQDVSIYSYNNYSKYCRLIAASSNKGKSLGKTIKLSDYTGIYNKLLLGEIYINTELNPDYPIMIGGTYDNGHLASIIMIWTLPYENSNLYEKNNFSILCTLVGKTLTRANDYMESINQSYNLVEGKMLNSEAFSKIHQIYRIGSNENIVDYTILNVTLDDRETNDDLFSIVKGLIRDTDYIGEGEGEDGLCILLTNTNLDESNTVRERLNNRNVNVQIGGNDNDFIIG